MSDFLTFRNKIAKQRDGQLLFSVLRLRHWLKYEYDILNEPTKLTKNNTSVTDDIANKVLLEHLNVQHLSWDEAWWRALREKSKAPLFKKIGRYL